VVYEDLQRHTLICSETQDCQWTMWPQLHCTWQQSVNNLSSSNTTSNILSWQKLHHNKAGDKIRQSTECNNCDIPQQNGTAS